MFGWRNVENEAHKFENLSHTKVTDKISHFNPGFFSDMDP
jgi:hypothetical protein